MGEEQWDRVTAVNLKGCYNFICHIAPLFSEQKYSKIINVSSINGLRGKFGQTKSHSAAKAGLIGHTKAVARELGSYGANINAVAPGLIETAMIGESEDRDRITDKSMA
jgi:3-oxoacyl-[acyl-carrier protein] reductase